VIVFSRAGCTLVGRITVVVDPDAYKIISINYSSLEYNTGLILARKYEIQAMVSLQSILYSSPCSRKLLII
jgi:hypothetical protein